MDKVISLIIAVLLVVFGYWGYIAQYSVPGPDHELVIFLTRYVMFLLLASLLCRFWPQISRIVVYSLRCPVLVALGITLFIMQFLMWIEHRIVRLGHRIIPTTSKRGA